MKQIKLGHTLVKHLVNRGLPRDILRMRPFDLSQHTVSITSEVEGMKTKKVLKNAQLEQFEHMLEKPFSKPLVYVMSSSPNDGKAKQAAAYMMEQATKGQLSGTYGRSTRGRQSPLWHMINGSWHDRLRDGADDQPSMLILSNITVNSTNVKLEKLRDLLEMYNHIPRIVVVTGIDPVTFANTKLMMPVSNVLQLATARKVTL